MSSSTPPASDFVLHHVLEIVDQLVAELRGGEVHRRVRPGDSLERDLGISSLERVELLVRLEQGFDVRLDDAAMAEADTPRDLAGVITTADTRVAAAVLHTTLEASPGTAAPPTTRTIVEALEWHAEHSPDRVQVHLRGDDGHETPLTNGALWQAAVDVANGLLGRGLRQHETVAIMLRTEPAFFSSFFGTLLAGGVPVPMYPPFRADRIEEYAQRQVGILRNADARLMITFTEVERLAALLLGQAPALSGVVTADELAREGATTPSRRLRTRSSGDEPALIQYTSGSTGHPKGVLLSHANLLANIRALQQGLDVRPDDVAVSWLPLYHDMGLIGAWLGTMYVGAPLALMSPLAFLARPSRWLWALHTHRGTLSPAPNFAYDLCSQRIPDADLEGLDLGSVRMLLNGSETVQPESLRRFITRFVPYGLKPESLLPVYGLAECSVGLAAPPPGRGPRIDRIDRAVFQESGRAHTAAGQDESALEFVSCGHALPDHEIRVVDEAGRPAGDRREGHVQFRGPSAASGYYRNADATRELVRDDGWLETGDLGYLANGELFLTGRRKDLIIKGGRNFHPHEAEEVVGQVAGVRNGCVAAFGVSDSDRGTERFVVVAETRQTSSDEREHLRAEITDRLASTLGMPPDVVVVTSPGAVLKTSSGKIRRTATRDAYLSGHLTRGRPALVAQWARLLVSAGTARLRRWAGRLARATFTGYVLLLLLLTGPIVWVVLALGPRGPWVNRLIGRWTRAMLALAGCRVEVCGLDHLRDLGPAVFVANHASYLDPALIMAVLPVELRFAAKSQLANYPLLGTAIRKGEHITIDKRDLSQQNEGASAVVAPLHGGESLFVFPEGTFVAAPGLLPFRLGAFRAAVETARPLVPVTIRGTRYILPAHTLLLRPGRITVTVGTPIVPATDSWQEIVRLRDLARGAIERETGEPE